MWRPPKSKLGVKLELLNDVPDAAYLTLEGAGDATNVMDFVDILQPLFAKGVNRLAFDFEKLIYFNETFEGFVTNQAKRLNDGAGVLVVVRPHPKLLMLLKMLGLQEYYRIADSREEAIHQLRTLAGVKLESQHGS